MAAVGASVAGVAASVVGTLDSTSVLTTDSSTEVSDESSPLHAPTIVESTTAAAKAEIRRKVCWRDVLRVDIPLSCHPPTEVSDLLDSPNVNLRGNLLKLFSRIFQKSARFTFDAPLEHHAAIPAA
jgi:hypothetical protein